MKEKSFIILISIVLFISLLIAILLSNTKSIKVPEKISQEIGKVIIKPASPTPFAFEDMTVPYLRAQKYESSLGSLDQISGNNSYTSYLTSYTSDGFKINGLLTKPTGEEPAGGWPAIVFIHGYIPPRQYATLERYTDYVDYLARNGFVVFKIDLRGHGASEGEPGGGYFGSDYIVDTLNAYAALESSEFVNPKHIGLWGHSMAGNVILRSLAVKPEIPAAAIWAGAVYTYTDRDKYGISDASFSPDQFNASRLNRRRQLFEKYGSPSAQSPFWKLVIPTNYLSEMKGAIALFHAVDDDTVNVGYSRDLNTLLNKTDLPHELHEYPSGGHNISGGSFSEAMQATVDFFKRELQ